MSSCSPSNDAELIYCTRGNKKARKTFINFDKQKASVHAEFEA